MNVKVRRLLRLDCTLLLRLEILLCFMPKNMNTDLTVTKISHKRQCYELSISHELTCITNDLKHLLLYSLLFCHTLLTIPNDGRKDLTNPEELAIPLCYVPFRS